MANGPNALCMMFTSLWVRQWRGRLTLKMTDGLNRIQSHMDLPTEQLLLSGQFLSLYTLSKTFPFYLPWIYKHCCNNAVQVGRGP